jgi:ribosome-associated toxin RatA of RatAB toxin-antitoxin module
VPHVRSELSISAPVERVYSLAKQIERLPEFIPNVERVTVRSREGTRTVSEWVGRVPEFNRTIAWVEEDEWDDAARRCQFRSVSGDWDRYQGVWSFSPEGEGTRVLLTIDYEYNVPLIGPLIKKLLHKLVGRSAEETLEGLRAMAEESGRDAA